MVEQIVVLSILYWFSKDQSPISFERVRHGRVILSQYDENIVSEDDYFQAIEALSDDKYINLDGNLRVDKDNGRIILNRTGIALVESIGERTIGLTNFKRIRKLVVEYLSYKPADYVKVLGEKLKVLEDNRKNKIKNVDHELIRAIGILLNFEHKNSSVFVHHFKLDREILKNEDDLDRYIVALRNQLRSQGIPVKTYREKDILYVVSYSEMNKLLFLDKEIKPFDKKEVNTREVVGWNPILASFIVERWLRNLGYVRTRKTKHKFVNYRNLEISDTEAGTLREFEALNLNFQDLKNNHVFVWIENYNSIMKSTLDFMREEGANLHKKEEIFSLLEGIKLRIIPSYTVLKLKDVIEDVDLSKERVPGLNFTFKEYWERTYDFEITQDIQPLFLFEGWNGDLHYPAETISVDRSYLERQFGKFQGRRPKHEKPKERVERAKELYNLLELVKDGYLSENVEIKLQACCPLLKELLKLGGLEDVIQISPPLLEFYRGSFSLDPLDIFYPFYDPACGKKNLSITHLILPKDITESEIDTFVNSLNNMFQKFGFGTIRKSENLIILDYDVGADIQKLEGKIRDLNKLAKKRDIGIAVIPDDSRVHYYSLKRLFPARTGVPLQDITFSSFKDIVRRSFRGSKILSLKILIKTLDEGEAIWTLSNSAGLSSEKTLFVGMGFSRFPREKKVSKCAAVLHGPHGDRISWKVFSTPQERTITKQWFDSLLFRIQDIVENERPTRLVFYRTGTLYPIESENVNKSIRDHDWLRDMKVSFVSVLDGGDCRYCMAGQDYKNIPAGYGMIINSREACLSTSNYDQRVLKQGTVIPMRLKLEIGEDEMLDVMKEYHDLTYLNWRSPVTTAKQPFVLKIADRFADLTREDVPVENMFYLDL